MQEIDLKNKGKCSSNNDDTSDNTQSGTVQISGSKGDAKIEVKEVDNRDKKSSSSEQTTGDIGSSVEPLTTGNSNTQTQQTDDETSSNKSRDNSSKAPGFTQPASTPQPIKSQNNPPNLRSNQQNGQNQMNGNDGNDFGTGWGGNSSGRGGLGGGGFGGGWGGDPWSDPWGSGGFGGDGGANGGNSQQKRLTPQERVKMIEKVYKEVLNRKPDTRDINYYKYSTLSEEEIRKQLLEGKEHKQLTDDGREFKKMKERAEQAETRIKMLEGQIKDQVEEFKELTQLLREKNSYIQKLRQEANNPYSLNRPPTIHQHPASDTKTLYQDSLRREALLKKSIEQENLEKSVSSESDTNPVSTSGQTDQVFTAPSVNDNSSKASGITREAKDSVNGIFDKIRSIVSVE